MMSKIQDPLLEEIQSTAEKALMNVARDAGLEYAEISPQMRVLLAKAYMRGALDILQKLKTTMPYEQNTTTKK
jgi:hypothetical protein